MNLDKIKTLENDFFSLSSSERIFLLKRISSRMSPYNPVEGPMVTLFPAKHTGAGKFDVDLEREITSAIEEWERVPFITE